MTVSYTAEVASCRGLGCFLKLLLRWRGSIYKLVWPDLLLFLVIYFGLSGVYRFALTSEQQITFERICRYCEKYGNLIPLSFVLGFYVSIVVDRWWGQYKAIPWPDSVAIFVSAHIQGQDEKGRMMRRAIMRYVCLALTLTFARISPRVKKRFPTYVHFVESGLLLENEREIIEEMDRNVPNYSKHWLPIVWAGNLVTRARKEGKIRDDFAVKTILDELNKFRSGCGLLTTYDWISVPLVYTQVVTLAVYSYFLACTMGRQWLHPGSEPPTPESSTPPTSGRKGGSEDSLDLFFPFFTTLQFFFYMGWLKVAESLVNPFGDDDDDFELNWMVDRNLQVSYLIVDEMHNHHPELLKDQYWDAVFPLELPHTRGSEAYKEGVPEPSTTHVNMTMKDGEIVSPPSIPCHMSSAGSSGREGPIYVPGGLRPNASRGTLHSVTSVGSQAPIVGSGIVSSILRRVFSSGKDLSSDKLTPVETAAERWKGSSLTIQKSLIEAAIPELDENQLTIVSTKEGAEEKPTVQEIFGGGNERWSNPSQTAGDPGRFTTEKVVFTVGGEHSPPSPPKPGGSGGERAASSDEGGSDGDNLLH